MKNYYILFIVCTFLYACRRGTGSETIGSTSSDLSKMDRVAIENGPDIRVESCIEKIEYVKLGKTDDVLIGKVTHLLFTPDHIIVGDTYMSKAVFVFDREGNVRTVINRLGRGPQEYQDIIDVFLTPDKKTIGIINCAAKQVLYFDMDGNFKQKQSLPFSCREIEWLDDETMILVADGWQHFESSPAFESYPNKQDLLFFTHTTAQNIHSSTFVNPFDVNIFHFQPLDVKRFDDRIYACKAFGDTIYQVTKESIFPRYWLDMKGINGKANFGKDITGDKLYESPNYTNFPNIYTESDDYAFFILTKENEMFPVLFNKHTKHTYNVKDGARSALGIHLLFTKFALDNRLVAIVPAFQFLVFSPKDVPGIELHNEIKEGLSDEDNPVLLFYTLKAPDQ